MSKAKTPVLTRLSKEDLRRALPAKVKNNVDDSFVELVNDALSNSDIRSHLRENIIGYATIMNDGRYKLRDYLGAVKYVTYKLMGNTNQDSYYRTFPERVARLVGEGASENKISGYVAAFNKNKLVNMIWEQTLIPVHIINAEYFQEAINRQVHLMQNAKSELVQCNAANSVLHHLKPPEVANVELSVKAEDSNSVHELREALTSLATTQKELIEQGVVRAGEIAKKAIMVAPKDITPKRKSNLP